MVATKMEKKSSDGYIECFDSTTQREQNIHFWATELLVNLVMRTQKQTIHVPDIYHWLWCSC